MNANAHKFIAKQIYYKKNKSFFNKCTTKYLNVSKLCIKLTSSLVASLSAYATKIIQKHFK